ncbi:MAG: GNAT family N-acetyltransferase, partial [Rhizobiaceae bacterium]
MPSSLGVVVSRMNVTIRPAVISDIDRLVAIENAVFATDRLSRRSFRQAVESPTTETL